MMEDTFDFIKFAQELLFVSHPEIYPPELWVDFQIAVQIYLSDDDLSVLRYVYSYEEVEVNFEIRVRLAEIFGNLRESRIFYEMLDIMDSADTGQQDFLVETFFNESNQAVNQFGANKDLKTAPVMSGECIQRTAKVLAVHGLTYEPFLIGNFRFDSTLNRNPVSVWRFSEKLPNFLLCQILEIVKNAGYRHLFIVIDHQLLDEEFPPYYGFPIKYTVLPISYSEFLRHPETEQNLLH